MEGVLSQKKTPNAKFGAFFIFFKPFYFSMLSNSTSNIRVLNGGMLPVSRSP